MSVDTWGTNDSAASRPTLQVVQNRNTITATRGPEKGGRKPNIALEDGAYFSDFLLPCGQRCLLQMPFFENRAFVCADSSMIYAENHNLISRGKCTISCSYL